ncbi:MAG: START domain-containing protein [Saprospiraceae bacterium]
MKTIKKITFLALGILLFSSFSETSNWSKRHDKNGLKVYTRTDTDGLKEFKAIITVDYSVDAIVALMNDYENHENWMSHINECKFLKGNPKTTKYLYYEMYMPWPLSNRDVVSKSTFLTYKNGAVKLSINAVSGVHPKTKHVRINEGKGYWYFEPVSSQKTKIIYQYKADPVGIPSSIVGWFLVDGPVDTISEMRKELAKSKY